MSCALGRVYRLVQSAVRPVPGDCIYEYKLSFLSEHIDILCPDPRPREFFFLRTVVLFDRFGRVGEGSLQPAFLVGC